MGKREDNGIEYLFIETSRMRRTVQKFGSVVMMDHTYKINKNKMPGTVFMCMDGQRHGRSAGYAFVAHEKAVTIANVVESFVEGIGPKAAQNIKTFH